MHSFHSKTSERHSREGQMIQRQIRLGGPAFRAVFSASGRRRAPLCPLDGYGFDYLSQRQVCRIWVRISHEYKLLDAQPSKKKKKKKTKKRQPHRGHCESADVTGPVDGICERQVKRSSQTSQAEKLSFLTGNLSRPLVAHG